MWTVWLLSRQLLLTNQYVEGSGVPVTCKIFKDFIYTAFNVDVPTQIYKYLDLLRPRIHLCMAFKVDVPTLGRTHIIYKYLEMLRPRIHLCTAFKVDVPTLGCTHIIYQYLELLRPRIHLCMAFKVDVPTLGRTHIIYKYLDLLRPRIHYVRLSRWMSQHYGVHTLYINT